MTATPKVGPSQAATQGAANGQDEKLPAAVAGQGFEDFLNANQGSSGKPPAGNYLPPGQAAELLKAKREAAKAVSVDVPPTAALTMTGTVLAPSCSTRKVPPKADATKAGPPANQPAATAPPEALAAMLAQPVPPPAPAKALAEPTISLPGTETEKGSGSSEPSSAASGAVVPSGAPSVPPPVAATVPPNPAQLQAQVDPTSPLANAALSPAAQNQAAQVAGAQAIPEAEAGQTFNAGFRAKVQGWAAGGAVGSKAGSAEFAALRTASAAKGTGRAGSKSSSSVEVADNSTVTNIGTSVAKQGGAMAIKAQMQGTNVSFRTEAPGAAEPERTPQSQGSTAAKTLPAQQEPDPQQPTASVTPTPAFSISSPATFTQKASATAVPTTTPGQEIANTALNKVIESADKMRSDGKTSVELQVKLDDGQQLSVRLQMTQGTIRPVFKTESPELRQAIEQNWAGFKSSASERGLEIATPVFESPGSGSGFNPYGNRDQSRQSAGDPSDTEAMESSPAPGIGTGAKPVLSQPQTASQTGSAVQMYA